MKTVVACARSIELRHIAEKRAEILDGDANVQPDVAFHPAAEIIITMIEPDYKLMRVGLVFPNSASNYEVTVNRAGRPTIGERLHERAKLIEALLATIHRHICDIHDEGNFFFNVAYTVDERIAIKRAKQLLEDVKACENRSATSTATNGSGSTGAKASAGSASTS